jgi:serine/threonine protein kinase
MKMEAIVLSELQHANVIQVYDAGVTDLGMVWIAMERLNGQTLRQVLHRVGRLPLAEALHYASEIADGVDAVHEVNVIHRDLKPENVFITDRNEVKVLDLGTGKFTGYGLSSTDRMKVIGTTAYMSPEQIKGLDVDARADVYALGLIVYEMIAGRHPLVPAALASLPHAPEQMALLQLEAKPAPLTSVVAECPSYVARIIEQAIAKRRDSRHPTMTAFCRELRAARKRFIADEQGLDEPFSRGPAAGERLRDKFGAPPRGSEAWAGNRLPGDAGEAAGAHRDRNERLQFGDTEVDARRPDAHEPTLELPSSSLPAFPPGGAEAAGSNDSEGAGQQNRTTNTNPIGLLRGSDVTPEPHSFPGGRRRPRPGLRRMAVTLGLGALIGIPPAIAGVWWRMHRGASVALPSDAPSAMTLPVPSAEVAVRVPATAAAEEGEKGQESSASAETNGRADGISRGESESPPGEAMRLVRPRAPRPPGRPANVRPPAKILAPAREPGDVAPILAAPVFPVPLGATSAGAQTPSLAAQNSPISATASGATAAAAGIVPAASVLLPPSGL